MVLSCFSTYLPVVNATAQKQLTSEFNYIDENTGDLYTFACVSNETSRSATNCTGENTATIVSYINGVFVEKVYANVTTNTLQTTYPDGEIVERRISDVVAIADISNQDISFSTESTIRQNAEVASESASGTRTTTDYIANEPFVINSRRVQADLPGAATYFGYQAMGYRTFTYPESGYVFLQRKNSGVEDTYQSRRFEISAGTTVATVISIILAAFDLSGMLYSIAASLVTAALGTVIDYARSATVTVVQFRWDYRIRLGSNGGYIIAEHTRLRDYWEMYVAETDSFAYEYRSGYDDGTTLLSNSEMINMALSDFFAGG